MNGKEEKERNENQVEAKAENLFSFFPRKKVSERRTFHKTTREKNILNFQCSNLENESGLCDFVPDNSKKKKAKKTANLSLSQNSNFAGNTA